MKMRNRTRPRTDPWGTPDSTGTDDMTNFDAIWKMICGLGRDQKLKKSVNFK